MALAARSSAEPRTGCPVCGGSIHPIAGKCKHCKTDLVKLRKQQQAGAGTPPPARQPYGGAFARPPTAPVMALPPVLPPAGAPAPIASAPSAPIFAPPPPNFAAPMPMTPAPVIISAPMPAIEPYMLPSASRGAWSRSWPIVVAVIAAGAIVVSVILLLTGGGKNKKIDHTDLSPAPDRMNTDPLPTPPSDPWQNANPSGNTPAPDPVPPAPAMPAAPAAPVPAAPVTGIVAPPPEQFSVAQWRAVCSRLASCTGLDPQVKDFCDTFASSGAFNTDGVKDHIARGDCTYDRDKAVSCLTTLSNLPCSTGQSVDIGKISQLISGASDCGDVLRGTCQ